ncbi:hypothetical protein XAP412_800001 [Xanthomonas phaseoli pv. phaseoli]|uniref:Uncharacterized protein n=1 Tax=Xanthomonas campestris pv. phaseoli TaxID=317013 RepID=A0AB38E5Y3_XANCH
MRNVSAVLALHDAADGRAGAAGHSAAPEAMHCIGAAPAPHPPDGISNGIHQKRHDTPRVS